MKNNYIEELKSSINFYAMAKVTHEDFIKYDMKDQKLLQAIIEQEERRLTNLERFTPLLVDNKILLPLIADYFKSLGYFTPHFDLKVIGTTYEGRTDFAERRMEKNIYALNMKLIKPGEEEKEIQIATIKAFKTLVEQSNLLILKNNKTNLLDLLLNENHTDTSDLLKIHPELEDLIYNAHIITIKKALKSKQMSLIQKIIDFYDNIKTTREELRATNKHLHVVAKVEKEIPTTSTIDELFKK